MNKNDKILLNTLATSSGNSDEDWSNILPMVKRISAQSLAMGGTRKSKPQQLRENRLNKLRQLDGKKPNVTLPDDEEVPGLVPVKPLSAPSTLSYYIDFKYSGVTENNI